MQHQYWYFTTLHPFTLICIFVWKPNTIGLNWTQCTISSSFFSPSWYFWTPGFTAILSLNHDKDTLKLASFLGPNPEISCYQVYCLILWQVSFQEKTHHLKMSHNSVFPGDSKWQSSLSIQSLIRDNVFLLKDLKYFIASFLIGRWAAENCCQL